MRFRFHLVRLAVTLGFIAVLGRLGYLQLWCHDRLLSKVENQSQRTIREAPRRGPILDRNGAPLAESMRTGSCYADPRMVRQPREVARRLAPILQMPAETIAEKMRKAPGSFVWLKRFMSLEQARAVEKLNLSGVGLAWEYRRAYPDGDMASHLLGFVGSEGRGLSGMEMIYDEWLVQDVPERLAFRDGRGVGVSVESSRETPEPAYVRLTIDRTLQYMAERELEWGMKRSKSRSGQIIVQDPWTGEILAAASRPNLALSGKADADPERLAIPSVHTVFEPGSTFKIVTAAAVLEEEAVRPQETFYCENGAWKYSDVTIHDHTQEKILSFAQVMERSSNIGFAKAVLRLKRDVFFGYVKSFGFGTLTGSEIPGESSGLLNPLSRWSGVTMPMVSFGQEIGVTALQLACAYSAVANGGSLLEPRFVREVRDQHGEVKTWPVRTEVRRVSSPKTAEAIKRMLQGVVSRGTGQAASLDGWTVAGKTGTAQKIDPRTRRYSPDKFVASFCGFVPADKPRLTIVVVYDEPQGISWGGYNAGPVFKNVAWHALSYLGVTPDRDVRLAARRGRGNGPS
jgi:cell division protein FtsI (penicillin-binding protein 3)